MPLSTVEAVLLAVAVIAYLGAFVAAVVGLRAAPGTPGSPVGRGLLVVALLVHVVLLGARARHAGEAALTDPLATLLFLTGCCTLTGLVVDARESVRSLPLFLVPPVVVGLLLGTAVTDEARLQLPRLDDAASTALRIHVATALVAYAAFALSALLGLMYLLVAQAVRRKRLGSLVRGIPPLERLETLALRSDVAGLALLALSLALGVVAQRASGFLGPEWLTDPKTLLAAGTWVAYAAVVALHRNGVVFGRQQALAHCAVFGLVMFTWVGTPLLLGTPHP